MVLIFAGGIPLALFVVIYDPALWPLSFNYGVLVVLAAASDVMLALSPRALTVRIATPDRLSIGEGGAIVATLAAAGHRRTVRFELIAEQRGEVEAAEIVSGALLPGQEGRIALPVVPTRRGRVNVDRVWMRWRGPLALVEFTRQVGVERSIDVVPNVRGVHGSALQFFVQEAIYGIKAQHQKGEGAEFEALREYMPGLDSRFIDWKHSARHRKLLCKEFRTERNHQVIMAFDTAISCWSRSRASRGSITPSMPPWCWPGSRCKAAIWSAPTGSMPRCGNISDRSAGSRAFRASSARPPSSTISTRRPTSPSASPSSMRGSSAAPG
jgi:uncharacterized protein (DUF58 family)